MYFQIICNNWTFLYCVSNSAKRKYAPVWMKFIIRSKFIAIIIPQGVLWFKKLWYRARWLLDKIHWCQICRQEKVENRKIELRYRLYRVSILQFWKHSISFYPKCITLWLNEKTLENELIPLLKASQYSIFTLMVHFKLNFQMFKSPIVYWATLSSPLKNMVG